MKLYGISASSRSKKIIVAAAYAQVDLTVEEFFPRGAPEDVLKEFKKKNPNVKVPTLETPQGCIYESNAILRYIARQSKGAKLYGSTKFEEAQVDQYLDWVATLLEPSVFPYYGPFFGYSQFTNEETHTQNRDKAYKALSLLDGLLAGKNFIVGSSITIADILIVTSLGAFYRYVFDESVRNQFPNVSKYVERISNEEPFTRIQGKYVACKTPIQPYTGPLPQHGAEEAKKAEPKKKEAPQPKKEAPKPKKKEEDEEEEPKEVKAKNPLDSLPPSSFNLFDYKTLFVNHPSKKEALQTFWEQFDNEGYSVWRMEYEKAEGEGKVTFLTSNLMNGFLQRLESFRKYAFGVVGIYGDEPNLEIRGCWVWRGTEIPFEIKDHPSGEWYHFRKLDVKNSEEDRKIQEEYWTSWTEDVDKVEGLTCRDVKYFK